MFLNFQICSKQNDRYQFGCLSDNGVVPCRKMQLDPEGEKHFASFKYVFMFFESKRKPTKTSAEDQVYCFKYDRNKGVWKMMRRCVSEPRPDHVTVVFDVMEAAAINLTREDLTEYFKTLLPRRN